MWLSRSRCCVDECSALRQLTGLSAKIASSNGTITGSTLERMYASFSALLCPDGAGDTLAAMTTALGVWLARSSPGAAYIEGGKASALSFAAAFCRNLCWRCLYPRRQRVVVRRRVLTLTKN